MDQCWLEFSFPVPIGDVDTVAEVLHAIGCLGLNVDERQLDTFVVPGPDEHLPSSYQVKAYFNASAEDAVLAGTVEDRLRQHLPDFDSGQVTISRICQEDWAEGWKQHFPVMRFGPRLVIAPTWETFARQEGDAVVTLDPGMAFGTGSHETTRLCLHALADRFERVPPPRTVLDVGAGSGILALAAAALGAKSVVGCEIDPEACRVAEENVALNRLTDRIAVTNRPIEEIDGRFDLVIANIMAEENVRLAEHLMARLASDGCLVLSGILAEKKPFVRAGFAPFPLPDPVFLDEGEWCCIVYDRRGEG